MGQWLRFTSGDQVRLIRARMIRWRMEPGFVLCNIWNREEVKGFEEWSVWFLCEFSSRLKMVIVCAGLLEWVGRFIRLSLAREEGRFHGMVLKTWRVSEVVWAGHVITTIGWA